MLISYPILSAENVHDDEDIYLGNFIQNHLIEHEGRYPVSSVTTPQGPMHRWHGGVHLFGGGQPIRAVADGTVVAYRFAAARETYEGQGDYDTSFVLLRHETQTGENTAIVFYSLYMHLANRADLAPDRFQQLPQWMRQATPGTAVQRPQNQRIWRKDVLGFAGRLYGVEAAHFEVFMLDADFNRIWRDSTQITGTGSDDWFGDAHFVIPAQQQFQARHPNGGTTGPHSISFGTSQSYALPVGQGGQNDQELYVSVKLHQGRRIATTYRAGANGLFEQVGAPVVQDDYEYELYRLATALYSDCPSAGFEWLRFGRMLGADTTTNQTNWQLVRYGEAEAAIGYIDLARNTIRKLSDADFPHWLGWERRDEGQTASAADGLCDDQRTLDLAQAAQSNAVAARKLQHLICKAPTEWDDSDLAIRYARLREPGQPLHNDVSWTAFQQHVSRLAFWSQTGIAERSVWHFHPLQFVRHFRKCGWLSLNEMVQCVPRVSHKGWPGTLARVDITFNQATARCRPIHLPLNRTFRKYNLVSHIRQAHFFAQVYIETDLLQVLREYGRGRPKRDGTWAAPAMQYYTVFYGRGLMQLTWPENYEKYGQFRSVAALRNDTDSIYADPSGRISATSQHYWADPRDRHGRINNNLLRQWAPRFDPEIVADDVNIAADSGGFYWVSKHTGGSSYNINRVCDLGLAVERVGRVSNLVNGGSYGYFERQAYAPYVANVLLDEPPRAGTETKNVRRVNITINYERQI